MTRLEARIIEAVDRDGPMRFDRYMEICLLDPEFGYYRQRRPAGGPLGGDFTTAPEVSQMFGELIGLWLLNQSRLQGIGKPQLAELGPGNGTLMADALRAIAGAGAPPPPVHLVEISEPLREMQRKALTGAEADAITWSDSMQSLPEEPLLVVANEFFDALPVRRFKAEARTWREVTVAHGGGRLEERLVPAPRDVGLPAAEPGLEAELCPALPELAATLSARVARHGGAVLVVDYGQDGPVGNSIQAVRRHRPADPLADCGETDITAWVDFSLFRDAARTHAVHVAGPAEQGPFLKELGLHQRAEALAEGASPEQCRQLLAAVERLSGNAHMGSAFKALALLPPDAAQPVAGFAPGAESGRTTA